MRRVKKKAHAFESAIVELITGGDRVTGSASASLQKAYKEDEIRSELIKTNEWDKDLFNIIKWNAFGTVFREMALCDQI